MNKEPYDRGQYRKDTQYGIGDAKWTFWKVFWPVLGIIIVTSLVGYGLGWFGEAAQVAHEEFGPRATLTKYEWFKDASAQLDRKKNDIGVFSAKQEELKKAYEGIPRPQWPRTDLEQYNQWASEIAGVKASYNDLAAEYNAEMAKFNWAFANKGMLPKGAKDPLPREFKPYEEN